MDSPYRPRGVEWIRYRVYVTRYEMSHRYEKLCTTIANKLPKTVVLHVLAKACNAALYGEEGIINPDKITYPMMYDAINDDVVAAIDKIRADAKKAITELQSRQ